MDYKKKTVKRTAVSKRKKNPPPNEEKIVMQPAPKRGGKLRTENNEASIKVIKGRKEERQRNRIITTAVFAAILIAIIVFSVITPTGPFEYIHNHFSSLGSGSFPKEISGSKFVDVYTEGSLMYTLTDTHAEIINKNGKTVFSRQHEFNSPALSVSPERALIFDRGGRSAFVFNNGDVLHSLTFENEIYCADIGRNGTFAVATKSEGYASQVEVFNKNKKSKFVWYSSNELINNVLISDNGKLLAVSTVGVSGGEYLSKLRVFSFSAADPLYVFEYKDSLIYSLECVSASQFSVVYNGGVELIKWKKGTKTECKSDYSVETFRSQKGKWFLTVCGNKAGSVVTLYNKRGEKQGSFEFSSEINDITHRDNTVCILSDSYLYFYSTEGKQIADKVNLSGYDRIFTVSNGSVIAAGNFGIDKFKLEKGE